MSSLIDKIDVSHAFCHGRLGLGEYDLLGFQWAATTCRYVWSIWEFLSITEFGSPHGTQIQQRISDTVCYIMCKEDLLVSIFSNYTC